MLHIKLGERRNITNDPMGRPWVGYDQTKSNEELFEINRGRWTLGARANREKFAAFSYTGDHTIKFLVEIEGIEDSGSRRALVGRVLNADHPLARRYVGETALDEHRNPVTYFSDPEAPTLCACGCGERLEGTSAFITGHDQKAIHSRIARQWGSTLSFIDWFDSTFGPEEGPSGTRVHDQRNHRREAQDAQRDQHPPHTRRIRLRAPAAGEIRAGR